MCRLMAYIGPARLIADVVLWPDRSIIKQSYDARERLQDPSLPNHLGFGNLNGDGFGIGWYTSDELRERDPTPCMYKSITPAWNNENLARLSCKIVSPLVFAHVRAAYPGMPVSEQNCHPFQWGRYLWMHNGVVGGFSKIKRRLLEQLSDAAYNSIQSFHSDSAVSFAVFLNHLPDLVQQQSPDVLVNAMQAAISTICEVQDSLGVRDISLLNFVVSDGSTLIATRFVRPDSESAATLYYAEGASFDRQEQQQQQQQNQQQNQQHTCSTPAGCTAAAPAAAVNGTNGTVAEHNGSIDDEALSPAGTGAAGGLAGEDGCTVCGANNLVGSSVLCEASYSISYRERGAHVAFVASEPITGSTTDWVCVPKNTVLCVTREKGGFLSMLQSSVSLSRVPDPRLQEVSSCLASIAQGMHTKSRAWVARKSGQQQQRISQQGANPADPFAQSPFEALSSAMGDGTAAAADVAAGSFMDGLLGLSRAGAEPETVSMEEEHLLTGHSKAVLALVVDEPSGRLYSSSTDATVRAWDMADMACVAVIRGHSKPVTQLQLLGGRLLFTAAGGAVRVWDTRSFVCLAKIRTSFYSGAIRSMLVTGDGTIYVGHQDTTVKKYLPINAAAAAEAAGTAGVPFSPRATTAGAAGPVRQPDAQTDPSSGHVGPVNDLVACGSYICSAGGDTTVRVWRASDLELVRVLRGHRGSVLCLLAVGNMLLSGSRDNTIRVWDLDLDFMCRRTLIGHKDDVVHLDALGLSKSGGTTSDLARAYSGLAAGLNPADATTATSAAAAAAAGRTPSPAPGVMAAPVLVASASADGTVRVWGSNWTCLRVLTICAPTTEWGPGSNAWLEGLDQHSGGGHIHPHAHPQQQQVGCTQPSSAAAATAALLSTATAAAAGKDSSSTSSSAQAGGGLLSAQLAGGRAVKSPVPPLPPAAPAAAAAATPAVVAVVGFAGDGHASEQQQQQNGGAEAHGDAGVSETAEHRVSTGDLRCRTGHSSFNGWVNLEQQQQQQQQIQQQQQQPKTPRQQQQPRQPGSQHKQRQRQQRRQRQRHAAPATAALVVAISSHHVVGGFSDASIRLWHMDDVYLADLTEQLMTGQMQQLQGSDRMLEMWQDLQQYGASSASFNPFQALSFPGSVASLGHSGSLLSSAAAARVGSGELQMQLQMQQMQMQLAGPSPPMSPSGLAGQLMASFGQLAVQQGQQLLSEGSGKLLGVELLSNDRQRKRGVWCARLRDAGCCSSTCSTPSRGTLAAAAAASLANITAGSPKAAAAAVADAGVLRTPSPLPSEVMAAAAAAAAGVQCLACGSQDQQLVRALKEFVAIRTVSANTALHDECLRGAKYLSRLLEALGAEVKMAQPYEGKNPVVLGRLGHNPAYPTVAFYGHYDVQPAEEPDWRTNPFEMTAVDGYLCGRGTSDNKGPVLAFIYAVKEMLDCWRMAGLAAPINVAFMFEGEEENGSLGFQESVAANLDWFKDAVLVVISNTVWVGENKPCLTYGMRGMVTASLVVSGPQRDLHSGNDGGVFSEPMADLVQLLGSLHGPGGQISVPGFNNAVRPQLMDLAWQGLQHSEEFSMQSYREAIGVPELTAPPNTYDLLNKRWCSPSLSIVDIRTTTSNSSSSSTAGPTGSSSSSKPGGGLREYAHSAAVTQRSSVAGGGSFTVVQQHAGRLGGCPHGSHSGVECGNLWPSVVVTHTEKHGAAEAGAGGADDRSCYRFGPTRFSVIPKVAVGKISLRFVPEQDHRTLIECLQQHIEKRFKLLWSANKVELQVHSVGDWWEADPQSQLFQMAERAVRREWGEPPLYVREGGTMPVASLIEKMLGAPALMIPMGQSSDNCHLANERLRRVNLIKGKNVVRHLLEEVVAAAAPAAAALAGNTPAASPRQC